MRVLGGRGCRLTPSAASRPLVFPLVRSFGGVSSLGLKYHGLKQLPACQSRPSSPDSGSCDGLWLKCGLNPLGFIEPCLIHARQGILLLWCTLKDGGWCTGTSQAQTALAAQDLIRYSTVRNTLEQKAVAFPTNTTTYAPVLRIVQLFPKKTTRTKAWPIRYLV